MVSRRCQVVLGRFQKVLGRRPMVLGRCYMVSGSDLEKEQIILGTGKLRFIQPGLFCFPGWLRRVQGGGEGIRIFPSSHCYGTLLRMVSNGLRKVPDGLGPM